MVSRRKTTHNQSTIERSPVNGAGSKRRGYQQRNVVQLDLNGWIKEELIVDFGLSDTTDVQKLLNEYVYYYNNHRPAAALQYKSPVQFKLDQGF